MSVQAGIWNFDGRPVDPQVSRGYQRVLETQGPDGESCHVDGSVALLYRPFHTTAESRREKQPYFSHRGFILTWDGRLDNRDELIAELRGDLEAIPPMSPSSRLPSIAGRPTASVASSAIGLSPSGSRNSANYSSPPTTWPSGTSSTT